MEADPQIILGIIGAVGTVLASVWGLIRFLVKEMRRMNETFLSHLEKKNNHNERIASTFVAQGEKQVLAHEREAEKLEHAINTLVSVVSKNTEIIGKIYDVDKKRKIKRFT